MLTSNDVLNHSFTSTSFRRGYDELEVDEFLDELVETLRYYERGGRPARGVPAAPALPDPGLTESLESATPSDPESLEFPTPSDPETLESAGPSDPEVLESADSSDPDASESPTPSGQRASENPAPSDPDGAPVPDATETSAPSALPVMVSPTSRKYIERAQRASRWLREEPLP